VSCAAITLCVASQRVFIVVSVYFVIDSVRKLMDTPSWVLRIGASGVLAGPNRHVRLPVLVIQKRDRYR
jgi:hypothetical protein